MKHRFERTGRLVLLTLCTLLPAASAGLAAADAMKFPVPAVSVGAVIELSETGTKKYIGRLSAIRSVSLPARVSGKIMQYFFHEGDFVQKGDLLIQLEDTTYVAAKKSAEAKLMSANAQANQAKATVIYATENFDRENSLTSVNAKKEYDAAVRDRDLALAVRDIAEAAKVAAEADLLNANNNLSYTRISADFTGRISKTTYSSGNYVTPSSGALATLVQCDPIYIKFAISEPDYISMFGGNPDTLKKEAIVRIRRSDRTMYDKIGKIHIVDNQIDPSTGTIMLWAIMDNKDLKLTPGGLVDAMISKTIQEKKPAVPVSSLQISKAGQFVWVVDEKTGMVSQVPVIPGETVGDFQIVSGNLHPGQ